MFQIKLKPWFPQNKFLQRLISLAQNAEEKCEAMLEQQILAELKQNDYPRMLVDLILAEGIARRKNTKLQK